MKNLLILLFIPTIIYGQNDLSSLNDFVEMPIENILIHSIFYYPISNIIQYQDDKMYDMTDEFPQKFVKTDLKNDKIYLVSHSANDQFTINKVFRGKNLIDKSIKEMYNAMKYLCEKEGRTVYLEYRFYYNADRITWEIQHTDFRLSFICEEPEIID